MRNCGLSPWLQALANQVAVHEMLSPAHNMEVNALSVFVLLYLSSGLAESKRQQEVVAIDVKPSGQVAHESVKLVREGTLWN